MPWKLQWTFVSRANSSVGIQFCPTLPRRSTGRPDPTRLWYIWVFGFDRCLVTAKCIIEPDGQLEVYLNDVGVGPRFLVLDDCQSVLGIV